METRTRMGTRTIVVPFLFQFFAKQLVPCRAESDGDDKGDDNQGGGAALAAEGQVVVVGTTTPVEDFQKLIKSENIVTGEEKPSDCF